MKVHTNTIPICFLLILFSCWGCSDDDLSAPPANESRVVRAIVRPSPKEPISAPKVGEEETDRKAEAEKGGQAGVVDSRTRKEGQNEAEEKKVEGGSGYYAVQGGESLASVAAREDVFGDSLKWVILFRLNRKELKDQPLAEDLPKRELPSGLKLKILTAEEMASNRESRAGKVWTVNVKSGSTQEEMVPAAITLIKEGYPVYMSRVNVKGKDWLRIRVGFFENRAEADAVGKEIQKILGIRDTWSSRAGKNEIREFLGL